MTQTQVYFNITVFLLLGLPVLILSLVRGSGPAKKRLQQSLLLLGGMILLRFGGNCVLSWLNIGWRCTPRYLMSFLIWVLVVVSIARCLQTLASLPENRTSLIWLGSFFSLIISAAFLTILMIALYSDRLHEAVITVNGQTIIKEGKTNGGAVRRFYLPVNFLVHGQELEYDWSTDTVTLPTVY